MVTTTKNAKVITIMIIYYLLLFSETAKIKVIQILPRKTTYKQFKNREHMTRSTVTYPTNLDKYSSILFRSKMFSCLILYSYYEDCPSLYNSVVYYT